MPLWVFEAWDWIIRGFLLLDRRKLTWFDLPVMMKLTLSSPYHALQHLAKSPLTRPNNFMMIPQVARFGIPRGIDPSTFTLITQFSSERDQWMKSKCINIHDPQSQIYELTNEYDGRRAMAKNFFMLLEGYRNHHYCPGDDFFISRSRLMARQLSLDLRFFDLNCFSPELASGRLLGPRRRLPTMRDESWPNCFLPGRRSSSTL